MALPGIMALRSVRDYVAEIADNQILAAQDERALRDLTSVLLRKNGAGFGSRGVGEYSRRHVPRKALISQA